MAYNKVPNIKFNNGQEYPMFGLGTWKVNIKFNIFNYISKNNYSFHSRNQAK